MYHTLKKIITRLVSRKFLFEQEENWRHWYALFYSGTAFQCSVCDKNLSRFIKTENDSLCPNCGSLQRNRRLWQLLETEFLKNNVSILDFSPSRCLYRKLKKRNDIHYQSTDLSGNFIADFHWDITQLDCKNNTFDLVVCYHILEHIPNDVLAMQELFRILKPGGKILVQTPFKEGAIYENPKIVSEQERLIHFGQEDHVRIYSVAGLKSRLEQCGFGVEIRKYSNEKTRLDLDTNETILVLTKPLNTE